MLSKHFQNNKNAYIITGTGFIMSSIISIFSPDIRNTIIDAPYEKFGSAIQYAGSIFTYIATLKISLSLIELTIFGVSILATYNIYNYIILLKNKLKIVEAKYGANGKFFDISKDLNKLIIDNQLKEILSNNIGGDPIMGAEKKCLIKYKYNGKSFEEEFIERELINIPKI